MDEYDRIADWYDAFVQVDRDLAYFRDVARNASAVLELMAGTGRVSVALSDATEGPVTCVDRSGGMLRELERKAVGLPGVQVICADACDLPLRPGFDLVIIAFNSFAEVLRSPDQRRLVAEIWRVLVPGGLCILTLHNPVVRRRTLDGVERVLGTFDLVDGSQLEVTAAGTVDASADIATSRQTYVRRDASGAVLEKRANAVRFALISQADLERMVHEEGFEVEALHGSYEQAAFEPEVSDFMIWRLRRRPDS